MKDIYNYFNDMFVHGLMGSGIAILILLIFLFILNHFINKLIHKRWEERYFSARRIERIILYTIGIAGILAQIKSFQTLAATLLASGGILAVVIGLASQEAASNIINGFMILAYKPFRIGDFISVQEHNVVGNVIDISLRHTIIETLEKTQVIVPNTIMNKAVIENISNVPNKKANYLYINIAYESNVDKAIAIIQEEAIKHPYFIDPRTTKEKHKKEDSVKVHCLDFKDSSIALRASIYSKDNAQGFQMLSDLRIAIKKRFEKEGIDIPYPHHVIIDKSKN